MIGTEQVLGVAKAALYLLFLFLPACSSLFYFPDRNLYYPYSRTGFPAQEIFFKSLDGTRLFSWYISSTTKPAKGTIIQFHGNGENLSSHYMSLAWLTKQGYNLFVFDYRGYGRSEGIPDQEGTYKDALAALQKAYKFHLADNAKTFIVIGQSLGGAIAMRALADFEEKDKVGFLVLDSTFTSYSGIAKKKMQEYWFSWPVSPLAPLFFSNEYASTEALKQNKTPLLVIHDELDPSVPFSCGQEIYDLAKSRKQFWILSEGRHIAVFSELHPERREAFLKEIDRAATNPTTY